MTKKSNCLQNEENQDHNQNTIGSEGGEDASAYQIAGNLSRTFPSKYLETSAWQISGHSLHAFSRKMPRSPTVYPFLSVFWPGEFYKFGRGPFCEPRDVSVSKDGVKHHGKRMTPYSDWKCVCWIQYRNGWYSYADCCTIARNGMANVLTCNSMATS